MLLKPFRRYHQKQLLSQEDTRIKSTDFSFTLDSKGQLISKGLFGVIIWTKKQQQQLKKRWNQKKKNNMYIFLNMKVLLFI